MKEVTLCIDSLTVRVRLPRAVDLECRGTLSEKGIEYRSTPIAPATDVERRLPVAVEPIPQKTGVTISETAKLITDPDTGRYPHASPFRDELLRALKFAAEVWGDVAWESINESHWTKLLRRRCEALVAKDCKAVRATEITVSRLITVVSWLRDTKRVARDAAQWPRLWKKDVTTHWKGLTGSQRDPQPDRLRYTLEEFQRILAKADFDPRLYLLLRLAVGLRPGQVARARRSDLALTMVDWESVTEATDFGTFAVTGAGKKGGVVVDLTRGQRRAVDDALAGDGYLAQAEERHGRKDIGDYVLFPTGYIVGRVGMLRGQDTKLSLSEHIDFARHVSGSWIRKSWRTAEERAGIEHIEGRCTYGQRRLTVDVAVAADMSPSGIQAVGGWSDTKMPLTVYAEAENRAGRREARPIRARMLGEDNGVPAVEQLRSADAEVSR